MVGGPASRRRRIGWVLAVAGAVVLADQLSKTWAEHRLARGPIHVAWTLQLRLALNPGIAFSLGRGSTGLVTVVAIAILGAVATVAWRSRGRLLGLALGLILGGAAGNLADRLLRHHGGQVVDFIDLQWWPVFNVADAAVSCGVILALVVTAFAATPNEPEPLSPPVA